MTLLSTPMVVQVRSPSVESTSTRTTAPVVGRGVEHPHLEVDEVDAGQRRVAAVERGAQGVVEGVDRAVALADGDEALVADPHLHRGLGVDHGLVAVVDGRAAPGGVAVVGGDPVALEGEQVLAPAAGLAHEQLEGGVGRLEHEAQGLAALELVGEGGGRGVVEVDARARRPSWPCRPGRRGRSPAPGCGCRPPRGRCARRWRCRPGPGPRCAARPCGRRRTSPT